eukprot:1448216-Rhodomonas_salina.1
MHEIPALIGLSTAYAQVDIPAGVKKGKKVKFICNNVEVEVAPVLPLTHTLSLSLLSHSRLACSCIELTRSISTAPPPHGHPLHADNIRRLLQVHWQRRGLRDAGESQQDGGEVGVATGLCTCLGTGLAHCVLCPVQTWRVCCCVHGVRRRY